MIGFTRRSARDLLLRAIRARQDYVSKECERLPPWQCNSDELYAYRTGKWVRWLPSRWFQPALTPHQRNVAARVIRQMETDGLVQLVWSSPTRVYLVRPSPTCEAQVREASEGTDCRAGVT